MTTPATHKMACGDQIFAQVVCNGTTVVNVVDSNFGSMEQVMRYVLGKAGRLAGLARVKVRNASQGWSTDLTVSSPRLSITQA